jgi:hypothetical protein
MAKCFSYAIHASADAGYTDAIPTWAVSWTISADAAKSTDSKLSEAIGAAGEEYPGEGECVQ